MVYRQSVQRLCCRLRGLKANAGWAEGMSGPNLTVEQSVSMAGKAHPLTTHVRSGGQFDRVEEKYSWNRPR